MNVLCLMEVKVRSVDLERSHRVAGRFVSLAPLLVLFLPVLIFGEESAHLDQLLQFRSCLVTLSLSVMFFYSQRPLALNGHCFKLISTICLVNEVAAIA